MYQSAACYSSFLSLYRVYRENSRYKYNTWISSQQVEDPFVHLSVPFLRENTKSTYTILKT